MQHIKTAFLAALAALTSALSTPAQQVQVGAGTYQRQSSAAFFYHKTADTFDVFGQCEVTYGAPEWNPAHTKLLDEAKAGTRLRLGKDGWTTLDTNVPLCVGDVSIPAGIHYLALEAAGKGNLRLLVLDAAKVRKRKLYAALTDQTDGGLAVPMDAIAAPKDGHPLAEQLSITWRRAQPDDAQVELVLRWGNLAFGATLTPTFDGTKAG